MLIAERGKGVLNKILPAASQPQTRNYQWPGSMAAPRDPTRVALLDGFDMDSLVTVLTRQWLWVGDPKLAPNGCPKHDQIRYLGCLGFSAMVTHRQRLMVDNQRQELITDCAKYELLINSMN